MIVKVKWLEMYRFTFVWHIDRWRIVCHGHTIQAIGLLYGFFSTRICRAVVHTVAVLRLRGSHSFLLEVRHSCMITHAALTTISSVHIWVVIVCDSHWHRLDVRPKRLMIGYKRAFHCTQNVLCDKHFSAQDPRHITLAP